MVDIMLKHLDDWLQIALDLTSGLSNQDRFERLLATIKLALKCDASALLSFQQQQFTPLAINGLYHEVLGRRFNIAEHPRLEAIARAGDIVRFPSDCALPDPYDGLISNHEQHLQVHSCIGLPLMINDRLIGAITIDAFDPNQFAQLSNHHLRVISALAASSLQTALLLEQLENQTGMTVEPTAFNQKPQTMIGQSAPMLELKAHINAVAKTDLSVLIMGETGVGKELVATAVHNQSNRSNHNLVYLNCAALPESVAESELFGHIKGAFTGAISHRKGKFESADNGTLFLDEIGELSLALQAKLLRVLQYGDIQRVGSDNTIKVNTRIVAATNRNMADEVKAGRFRADLYHRLSVFPLFVPPLRDRDQDLMLLAGFFAERCQHKLAISKLSFAPATMEKLRTYTWPGNVRELEHMINRAAVLAKAETPANQVILQPHHFELNQPIVNDKDIDNTNISTQVINSIDTNIGLKAAMQQFQHDYIASVNNQQQGNWAATARILQVDSGNLHRLAKRLKLK